MKKDQYFASLLDAPDSEHKFVTPTKNVNGKDYDICFFQNTNAVTADNPHGVKFAYRDSDGKIFADPRNPGTLISDPMDLQGIRDVKVYADKSTGLPLIPDYDLAIIGSKKSSMGRVVDPDRGVMRPEELAIVEHLEQITHNMVRHGADAENPVGYTFEMSEKTPYIMYTPDGGTHKISNEQGYLDFINTNREKGFDLILNPRTGVELNKEGKYVLPPEELRINYEQVDKSIAKLHTEGKTTQAELATKITNQDIEYKTLRAVVPEAAYAMAAEKAAKGGAPVPSLAEFKVTLEKMQRKAKEDLKANLQKYSSTYGELFTNRGSISAQKSRNKPKST